MVHYSERHADLVKYTVSGDDKNGESVLSVLHPLSVVRVEDVVRRRHIPRHISLSSKETLQLYRAMEKAAKKLGEKTKQVVSKA